MLTQILLYFSEIFTDYLSLLHQHHQSKIIFYVPGLHISSELWSNEEYRIYPKTWVSGTFWKCAVKKWVEGKCSTKSFQYFRQFFLAYIKWFFKVKRKFQKSPNTTHPKISETKLVHVLTEKKKINLILGNNQSVTILTLNGWSMYLVRFV